MAQLALCGRLLHCHLPTTLPAEVAELRLWCLQETQKGALMIIRLQGTTATSWGYVTRDALVACSNRHVQMLQTL